MTALIVANHCFESTSFINDDGEIDKNHAWVTDDGLHSDFSLSKNNLLQLHAVLNCNFD